MKPPKAPPAPPEPTAAAKRFVPLASICQFLAGSGHPPLSAMRISQLVAEGMPKAGRGEYELAKCAFWYIGRLRTATDHKESETEGGGFTGVARERRRLLAAQADREEYEIAKTRRQLVAIADVEKILSDLVLETKARIMSVASRAAPLIQGEQSRIMIQAIIERELKEALARLSTTVPALPPPPPAAPAALPPAAGPKPEKGRKAGKRSRKN